jgi:hypothetical protein
MLSIQAYNPVPPIIQNHIPIEIKDIKWSKDNYINSLGIHYMYTCIIGTNLLC